MYKDFLVSIKFSQYWVSIEFIWFHQLNNTMKLRISRDTSTFLLPYLNGINYRHIAVPLGVTCNSEKSIPQFNKQILYPNPKGLKLPATFFSRRSYNKNLQISKIKKIFFAIYFVVWCIIFNFVKNVSVSVCLHVAYISVLHFISTSHLLGVRSRQLVVMKEKKDNNLQIPKAI